MLNLIRRIAFVLILAAAAFAGHQALAQSWSVQDGNGDPVQVEHNSDGSWTVTPEGGSSNTYGADSASNMENDYGISSGDFDSMQAQSGDGDGAASSDGNADNSGNGDANSDTNGDANSDASGGSDDNAGGGDSNMDSGGGSDGGGGESGGGGGSDQGD